MNRMYSTLQIGEKFTTSYKLYFKEGASNRIISPFHDIPLYSDNNKKLLNMVVEISRHSHAKFEIGKELMNPIVQDVKNGQPRFVNNVYPFCGYPWNYGAFPQTWENPKKIDKHTGAKGDNDPLDVIEIGRHNIQSGSVVPVKVLGCLALIDDGETDWKVICISVDDPDFDKINTLEDVEAFRPRLLQDTIYWLEHYKVPTKKPKNVFGLDKKIMNDGFAFEVIKECHEEWAASMDSQKSLESFESYSYKSVVEKNLTKDEEKTLEELHKIQSDKVASVPIESFEVFFME